MSGPVKVSHSCCRENGIAAVLAAPCKPSLAASVTLSLALQLGGWLGQGLGSLNPAFTTPLSQHSLRRLCASGADQQGNVHKPQSRSMLSLNALKCFPLPCGEPIFQSLCEFGFLVSCGRVSYFTCSACTFPRGRRGRQWHNVINNTRHLSRRTRKDLENYLACFVFVVIYCAP